MTGTSTAQREPEGRRRVGQHLAMLGKWAEAYSKVVHRQPLVSIWQFSIADQEKLLRQPACELRVERDANNNYQLRTVEGVESQELDPELVAFMRGPVYQRASARGLELMTAIEDASPAADNIQAATFQAARLAGHDDETAQVLAKKAFQAHLDAAAKAVKARWKQAKIERFRQFGKDIIIGDTKAYLSSSDEGNMKIMVQESFKRRVIDSQRAQSQTKVTQFIPEVKHGAIASTSSSPAHGSETTQGSLSSRSPPFFPSDDSNSPQSARRGSADSAQSHTIQINEGAPLNPFTYGPLQYEAGLHQAADGHLGAGLNEVFYNNAMSANAMFFSTDGLVPACVSYNRGFADAIQPFRAPFPAYSASPAASPTTLPFPRADFTAHAVFDSQSESEASFATQKPKARGYPLAVVQPFSGMTCYDVPFQGSKDELAPEYWTTKEGKARYLLYKSLELKDEDLRLYQNEKAAEAASKPIHIFVDLSNIIIGFYDSLKMKRGLPIQKRVISPPFSFNNFHSLVTRGRETAKLVVAGSIAHTKKKRPDYMLQAQELGYEMNILHRVPKPVSPTFRRKPKNVRELESATSETSGDDCFTGPMKNGEQGVDELLHLKILQSAIDAPGGGTIALATGDAAHAEYSDGFKSNIERALVGGWNIELYGWSRNISSAWREPEFIKQWGDKFRIIELDNFCEELFDMTIESLQRD
ncbi:hypothetical protein B0T16DRAFT_324855 [Cercophora newfieldiana]|uniref:Uncharacterized protein n=1 Tax=Cercophora newfieldiana TaxID=92897 RepID=A0AA40CTS7_9PEZI|nr:hypothetical protein B0T16DRAFT_324855 [Cercophora newfieldiana]